MVMEPLFFFLFMYEPLSPFGGPYRKAFFLKFIQKLSPLQTLFFFFFLISHDGLLSIHKVPHGVVLTVLFWVYYYLLSNNDLTGTEVLRPSFCKCVCGVPVTNHLCLFGGPGDSPFENMKGVFFRLYVSLRQTKLES